MSQITELLGKTLIAVEMEGNDILIFICNDGKKYIMHHPQDCCEHVSIEDINGDLQDLIGSPITLAEESCSNELSAAQVLEKENSEYFYDESFTWTFYKLATTKGYVDIRWYGTSNGYYSESVYFVEEGGRF